MITYETEIKGVMSLFRKNHVYAIVAYILMLALTAFIPLGLVEWLNIEPLNAVVYTNVVAFIIGVIIIYNLLREDIRIEKEANPLPISNIIGWTILGVFMAWFGQAIAVLIEMFVLGITPGSENTELIVSLTRMSPLFLLLPAIIGPIMEELVFRKVIFNGFKRKMNVYMAAILSSLIFGVFHLEFTHLLIYFVMGIILTFIYVQTKRIIVPILVHMSFNTITVLLQLSIDPEQLERLQQQLSVILLGS